MRIVFLSTGSRGDVQLYVALGVGLRAAGFDVRMVTHCDFAELVQNHGLDFHPLPIDSRAWHESPDGQKMIASDGSALGFIRHFVRLRVPFMRDILAGFFEGARDADVVMATSTSVVFGYSVAEKLGVPLMAAHLGPMTPSAHLASCLVPEWPRWLPGRRLYNQMSHLVVGECYWQYMRRSFNEARSDVLGLAPYPFLGPPAELFWTTPAVCGCSPLVVPQPRDWTDQRLTGYWFLNTTSHWKPSAELVDFLRAGPPPVCIGFGSMASPDADEFTNTITEALRRSGQRAILLTGWGGLKERANDERIFVTEAVPHDWLFPRVSAVVHHGGAGTTAAAIRAGVPSVIIPFMADQPFWGRRVYRLGIGPRPIPRRHLTADGLAAALTRVTTDQAMRKAARELGEKLRQEDGIGAAVQVIEEFCRSRGHKSEIRSQTAEVRNQKSDGRGQRPVGRKRALAKKSQGAGV